MDMDMDVDVDVFARLLGKPKTAAAAPTANAQAGAEPVVAWTAAP
ncbi:hypothetical protein [Streptomyces sp. MUSC 125]|nr:hypothetical protein [Streptomyces sp. MUSC 125]